MKKIKPTISRNPREVAEAMGLDSCHAIEWEIKSSLMQRIADIFNSSGQSITQLAENAKISRSRVSKILKGDCVGISLEMLQMILLTVESI